MKEKKLLSNYVLDTSALFTFLQKEEGAEEVYKALKQAEQEKVNVYASFVTRTELLYNAIQKKWSQEEMEQLRFFIRNWKIDWVHSSSELCDLAADIKANHSVSFADAFVAATAILFKATLIHKDPEFDSLESEISQHRLPYKK